MSMIIGPHKRNLNMNHIMSKKSTNNNAELMFDPRNKTGCFKCGNPVDYNFEYDSNYCTTCNSWLESVCNDPNCSSCPGRPKYPKYPG